MSVTVQAPIEGPLTDGQRKQASRMLVFIESKLKDLSEDRREVTLAPVEWPSSDKVFSQIIPLYEEKGWQLTIHRESQVPYIHLVRTS